MLAHLRDLPKYRGLIQSLVVRDLKARYRGSVLGFFWSFINPLLLLLIYTFVFTVVLPGTHPKEIEPYALFMFCGILPWTWFSSSLLESSNVLIAGGNLIKKVLFPAEVLPIVTVLANMVHFLLGLPILAIFLLYYRAPLNATDLIWFPLVLLTQLILTIALALIVSALTVHFRDLKDLLANLLTFWFFATPIIYSLDAIPPRLRPWVRANPATSFFVGVHDALFHDRWIGSRDWAAMIAAAAASVALGAWTFSRLRESIAEEA
jgi:ABC-type polysaccharide/polyol phosphate export permease